MTNSIRMIDSMLFQLPSHPASQSHEQSDVFARDTEFYCLPRAIGGAIRVHQHGWFGHFWPIICYQGARLHPGVLDGLAEGALNECIQRNAGFCRQVGQVTVQARSDTDIKSAGIALFRLAMMFFSLISRIWS